MGKIRAEGTWRSAGDDRYLRFCRGPVADALRSEACSPNAPPSHVRTMAPVGHTRPPHGFQLPCRSLVVELGSGCVCGDTVIWKPSSYTPLTAIAVTHIANKVLADHGLSGIFNLVIGSGREIGELVLNDKRVPLVSFTGSTQVGIHVSEAVAHRFGHTILELGGNKRASSFPRRPTFPSATQSILFRRGRHRWTSAAPRHAASSCRSPSATT